MDNKIIGELISLVRGAELSDKDKKIYTAFIRLAEERLQMGLKNSPDFMDQLLESYNKKKDIVRNKDKVAWEKLMKEEEKQLEALVSKEK